MKTLLSMTAALLALAGQSALAQEKSGNMLEGWTLGFGMALIHKDISMDDLSGQFTPPGLQIDIGNSMTPFLSLTHPLGERFEVELAGGYPPTEKIEGKGPATVGSIPYDGVVITKVKQFAPTVLLNYRFGAYGGLTPYAGIGVNFTHFYDIQPTAEGNAIGGGPTTVELSDSWGLAAQLGLRYRLKEHWQLNASLLKADVSTDMVSTSSGVERKSSIDFNPTVAVIAVDYTF